MEQVYRIFETDYGRTDASDCLAQSVAEVYVHQPLNPRLLDELRHPLSSSHYSLRIENLEKAFGVL